MLTSFASTVKDLGEPRAMRRLSRAIEKDEGFLEGREDIPQLLKDYAWDQREEIAARKILYGARWISDLAGKAGSKTPAARELRALAKVEYRHVNAHRSLLHRRIVALMQLDGFLLRERFIRASWVLVGVAVVVALCLIAFAWVANPPQDEPAVDTPTEASGDQPPCALVGN